MAFDVSFFDNGIFDGLVLTASQSLSGAGELDVRLNAIDMARFQMAGVGQLGLIDSLRVLSAQAGINGSGSALFSFLCIGVISISIQGAGGISVGATMTALSRVRYSGAGSQNSAMTIIKTLPELLMQGCGALSQPFSLRVLIDSFIGQGSGALSVGIYFGLLPTVATFRIELNTLAEQYQTLGDKLQ